MAIFSLMKRLLDLVLDTTHRRQSRSPPTARSEDTSAETDEDLSPPTPVIFRSELERIRDETTAARTAGVETGGVLFGTRTPNDELLVSRATGPGPNAEHHAAQFSPDTEHAQQLLDRLRADRDVVWIGTWHKHPAHMNSLSEGDVRQMREFVRDPDLLDEMLAIVVTHQGSEVEVNTFYMDDTLTPVRTGIDEVPDEERARYQSYCRYGAADKTATGGQVDVVRDSGPPETQTPEVVGETPRCDHSPDESRPSNAETKPASPPPRTPTEATDRHRSDAGQRSSEAPRTSAQRASTGEPTGPQVDGNEEPPSGPVQERNIDPHRADTDESPTDSSHQPNTQEERVRQRRVIEEYEDLQTHAAMRDVTLRQTEDSSEATSFIVRVVPANSNPLVFICAEGFPDDPPVVAVEGADSYEPLDEHPRDWSRQTAFREIVADILGSSPSPAR